ncbi:glycosyltransferase [Bifidobacterium amazonense]|uniref:Glycosyltransferase n=1 Tax=Bifidobacterium amazonense TaxID=2809027 RepID=A0ABS9VX35_9BIFI|nr:glycosyltransferase [Bifidobacterium amazonense]MCH9276637.1 glycosyltransferase [Bifidobacterium amazonense]
MTSISQSNEQYVHDVSVIIPVYGGEHTLRGVVTELSAFHDVQRSKNGNLYRVTEILPVFDHGRDRSDKVIRQLERELPYVHGVWLSRNFGQHPATLAGISVSQGAWVVTMDEDGQHDPRAIADMLDTALDQQADVVYADPVNAAPHSLFRNVTSWGAKFVAKHLLGSTDAPKYQSFRLILGDVARALATHAGNGTYLDVALGWISNRIATCPVTLRSEGDHQSSYNLMRLLGHFWRMVVTGGTRPLRFVSLIGGLASCAGIIWAIVLFFMQLFVHAVTVPGWTSLMIVFLVFSGLILLSIGIVAEYIGISVRADMGMPLYLVSTDPEQGPLGQGVRKGNPTNV